MVYLHRQCLHCTNSFSGEEEMEGEEGLRQQFLCPFCGEDFDMVGLCCHIDVQHVVEVKNGICPLCAKKGGMELVSHITTQHANLLKVQRKRRYRRGSAHNILRRELRDGNLQSPLFGDSSSMAPTNTEADSLLSSFIGNSSSAVSDEQTLVQPQSAEEICFVDDVSASESSERAVKRPPMSEKDLEEQERKCEFVRGLLMSTFLDDD